MALGRGFESLIPTDLIDEEFDPTALEDSRSGKLVELKIDKIVRDEDQPRKEFDNEAMALLADSIREHGVLQPIVVVKEGENYKIVAGERRWRASKMAGLSTMPAIVRTLDSQNRLELSIIENAQREDLNAIELATAYAKLKNQFNLSVSEIAKRLGKSESGVMNTLRLLNLSEAAKKSMLKHNLTEGVMRPLVSAEAELVERVLPKIIEEGWTARKVERFVAENKKNSSKKIIKTNTFAKYEDRLSTKFNAKVKVRGRSITIACKNEEELRRLMDSL